VRNLIREVRNLIREKMRFFSRPRRITQTGRSKFFFYDSSASGKKSINFVSSLVDRGVRDHLHSPISAVNQRKADLILDHLERDGIAIFQLNEIFNGEKIFKDLCAYWDAMESNNRDKIYEVRKNSEEGKDAQGKKPYLFSLSPDCSLESPHWQLAINPDILYVINSYMCAYSKIFQIDYFLNFPMRDKAAIKSQVWHRDGDGTVLKLFVYLSDVFAENGPFVYAPGSHKSPLREINYKNRPKSDDELRELLKGYKREFVTGVCKRGTAVLANTSGMHKGGHVLEGERKALLIAYYLPWIDRSDYGLIAPNDRTGKLHSAQEAALRVRS
jgi:hypothetical protein